MTDIKFEDAFAKLEKIVSELENGDLSLDDSIKKYEEGIRLTKICSQKLEAAKKKIEVLVKNSDGKFEIKPFEEERENPADAVSPKKSKAKRKEEEKLF